MSAACFIYMGCCICSHGSISQTMLKINASHRKLFPFIISKARTKLNNILKDLYMGLRDIKQVNGYLKSG